MVPILPDPLRGVASVSGQPAGYVGLQSYSGATVAFRHIAVKPELLEAVTYGSIGAFTLRYSPGVFI